ncbi:MAG TPA: Crp/Fnr family transcriptional regulator [Acidobacteriaceae bacterium]|nr:Crp/Fnr family transcriptional regulator [Acidobacteriaceae bacterium]
MPATSEVASLIKEHKTRLFEGLEASEVASITAAASKRRFTARSIITNEGYAANRLFLVIDGRARSFCTSRLGEKIPLLWFPPGEIFGGAAFLSRQLDYIASTEAVVNTSVLVWSRATIRSLSAQFPRLVENALLVAYDYFVAYRALHVSMVCHNARQRLAQVLVNLATGLGQRVEDGIGLDVRNEELANEANITIFTASRLLNEWQRKGILMKTRGKIVVRSTEALMFSKN